MKLNKLFYAIPALIGLLLASCGGLTYTPIDVNIFPQDMNVDTTSAFFTDTALDFTGDPESDFGAGYLLGDDKGDFTPKSADIEEVYVAFSRKYLFLGHKTTDEGTGDFFDRGAFYFLLDNGYTNTTANENAARGILRLDQNGLNNAGISGSFRFLDDLGTHCLAPRKITLYSKNYRTPYYSQGADFVVYNFTQPNLSYELIRGSVATVGWASVLENNVTEIAIPWDYIYPNVAPADIPGNIYMAFIINDAADSKYFDDADYFPNGQIATGTETITNWFTIQISTNL